MVIDPAHAEYDHTRSTFNALIDRRPAIILRCVGVPDILRALSFAKANGLLVAVRGGGHNVAGNAICDNGLVVDLSAMRKVHVDPTQKTARAQGGVTWTELDLECQRHNLATPGGTYGTTGIGGLTLGGGIGHLLGKYGLTCDNLVSAEVVTADGRVLRATNYENRDLFWGLRGGGGNFGVVSEFEYRLHPVGEVLGGLVRYPFEYAREDVRLFRGVMVDAPDELTCMLNLEKDPETGQKDALISVLYCGPLDTGEKVVESLRTSIPVLNDEIRPISYLEMQAIFGEIPFGLRHYWKGRFLKDLPDDLIDFTVDHFAQHSSKRGTILIEPLHGLARRISPETTAFNQRGARFNASAMSVWEESTEDDTQIAWAQKYAEALQPHSLAGTEYLNYMGHDESIERVRATYGQEKFQRLSELKWKFGPGNMFRFNQNIPPLRRRGSQGPLLL